MSLPPLAQIASEQREALEELIIYAGTQVHLARMLQIPQRTVAGWVDRGRISMEGAYLVQKNEYLKDHFPVSKLRPETNY